MNSKIDFDDVFIFLLVIFSLNFFSAQFAIVGILKNASYGYMLVSVLMSLPYFFPKNSGLVLPIQIISVSTVFSIVMAYIIWGQELSYGASTIPYLLWFFFFYLLHTKHPRRRIEKIVVFYGFVYIVLYAFQFAHKDVVYFGFQEEFKVDRGITRINFPGGGVFFLAYFISLNKVTEDVKYRWIFGLFLVLGLIVTVLQVTRQSIAVITLISLFHFLKKISLHSGIVVVVCFLGISFYFLNADNSISRGLLETQKETVSEGSSYIRILAADYFLNDFPPNTLARIFGNGFPNNNSAYGKFHLEIGESYGYYLSDLGLIAFYTMFGLFSLVAYLFIFMKSLMIRVPRGYGYLKYYMVLLLVTSLTSDNVYSMNFMFTNIFVLYSYQVIYEKNKEQND